MTYEEVQIGDIVKFENDYLKMAWAGFPHYDRLWKVVGKEHPWAKIVPLVLDEKFSSTTWAIDGEGGGFDPSTLIKIA